MSILFKFRDLQLIYAKPRSISVKYDGIDRINLKKISDITKVILHPKWEYNLTIDLMHGDLAIVHLEQPVVESETVKIIPITEKRPAIGSEILLTGWGYTFFKYALSCKYVFILS